MAWLGLAVDPVDESVPSLNDTECAWIEHARQLVAFECDATFGIQPDFYIGPANDITAAEWEAGHVRLPPVDLPRRFADRVTTAELLGHEAPLIEHYQQMVRLAKRHCKRALLRPFPCFRTEPAIIASGTLLTEFSWNEDVEATRAVLTAFVEAGTGPDRLVHCDADQGWELLVVAKAQATCWIEWDAEGPPPITGGFAADREELARLAQEALARLRIVHARLVEALGQDYWTYRRAQAPLPARISDGVGRVLAGLFRRPLGR